MYLKNSFPRANKNYIRLRIQHCANVFSQIYQIQNLIILDVYLISYSSDTNVVLHFPTHTVTPGYTLQYLLTPKPPVDQHPNPTQVYQLTPPLYSARQRKCPPPPTPPIVLISTDPLHADRTKKTARRLAAPGCTAERERRRKKRRGRSLFTHRRIGALCVPRQNTIRTSAPAGSSPLY